MSLSSRIVVTGLGVVSPLGNDPDTLWEALKDGQCAIKSEKFLEEKGYMIPKYALCDTNFSQDSQRGKEMALYAMRQSIAEDGFTGELSGVYIGTSMGESEVFEECAGKSSGFFEEGLANRFAEVIRENFQLKGPAYGYGAACAAGNYAIGSAADALRLGIIDVAFAGGIEPLSHIALIGFIRSRAMASGECKPFDKLRSGMQIGEGGAILRLEREVDAIRRGAKIYAVVGELGLSCDAYHPTSPRKDGSGMAAAMEMALKNSNLSPSEIDWVCAHGTATLISDHAESKALHKVFGSNLPLVTGFKGALGHTMGAASAIEALVCVLALQHQEVLKTVGFENPDEELDIPVSCKNKKHTLKKVINSAYGFGGINSCLILEKV